MATAQDLFPPVEITVRKQTLRWANLAELTAFWNQEKASFRPLLEGTKASRTNPAAQFLSHMLQRQNAVDAQLNEVNQAIRRRTGELTEPQRVELQTRLSAMATNVSSALRSVYAEDAHGSWLTSEPTAQFILELAKSNRDEAAFALLYLRGADCSDDSAAAKSGSIKAQLFRENLGPARSQAELASIGAITAKWQAESEKMVAEMNANKKSAAVLNETHAAALAAEKEEAQKRATAFADFLTERKKEDENQLKSAQEELKKLVDTYNEHMKLLSPVDYWRKKKERHLKEQSRLRGWAIFVGLGGFAIMGMYVFTNFHETQGGVVPWREIIGFFVLSSLVFWAVKILVRLLLSAIHLAEDAAEREVMAMTYMALVRGDGTKAKFLDEKDRALVLAPLFRPSATGVIDDGAPPHVSEIITKVGRRP